MPQVQHTGQMASPFVSVYVKNGYQLRLCILKVPYCEISVLETSVKIEHMETLID